MPAFRTGAPRVAVNDGHQFAQTDAFWCVFNTNLSLSLSLMLMDVDFEPVIAVSMILIPVVA